MSVDAAFEEICQLVQTDIGHGARRVLSWIRYVDGVAPQGIERAQIDDELKRYFDSPNPPHTGPFDDVILDRIVASHGAWVEAPPSFECGPERVTIHPRLIDLLRVFIALLFVDEPGYNKNGVRVE